MRFHKTINISYEMVYDSVTHEEHDTPYDMLPTMNKLALQNKGFREALEKLEGECIGFAHMSKIIKEVLEKYPKKNGG